MRRHDSRRKDIIWQIAAHTCEHNLVLLYLNTTYG